MQPAPHCPAPAPWWRMWASGLLLHWHLQLGAYAVFFFVFCFSPFLCCPLRFQRLPTDTAVRGFPTVWKLFLFQDSLRRTGLSPELFCLLYFPFKENGLPFWVPGVLHQCSEVVLWKLLSIQMIFWWICGGESDLPILFLHHMLFL